jgi:hypothetical protein
MREDTNPGFETEPTVVPAGGKAELQFLNRDTETEGFVAELTIAPQEDRSRHYFTLLYNRVESDYRYDPETSIQDGVLFDIHDYETLTFSATYLMRRNLRLIAEYTRVFKELQVEESAGYVTIDGNDDPFHLIDGTYVAEYEDLNRFVVGLVAGF